MMKRIALTILFFYLKLNIATAYNIFDIQDDTIQARHKVTLPQAHVGSLEIDTKLLDSYIRLPDNQRQFYLEARNIFENNTEADFTHDEIVKIAKKRNIPLMGGPMLGDLSSNSVSIWVRPAAKKKYSIRVTKTDGSDKITYDFTPSLAGQEKRIIIENLQPDTDYTYDVFVKKKKIANGYFKTAPNAGDKSPFKVAFGSCFHKIGLHNPNLIHQILKSRPNAMMLLGDIAVDDRRNMFNMHLADYLLRDVSKPWRDLASAVPLYTSWDDHDYFDNDLGGIPEGFTEEDRLTVREIWNKNWNNPQNDHESIYFNNQIGPVEIIMLDTRSLRENDRRGEYGAYLGLEQFNWLKETLKKSKAPFKVISSGTMWSDYISNGKDSWGTWDKEARKELFDFIEKEKIAGVLLISGDRHGARGFTIPQASGFALYEFQVATLGGVNGPVAFAEDTTHQLFGYLGMDLHAFGEFVFYTDEDDPKVEFRLIDQYGKVMEEILIPYEKLKP
ncbi:MAG: metallophosphoesterase family protein [Cyclobacteriaceae bacterium]|nr:metallophosphoesterase family protein [Cyclobacteriaceae bacterium]